MVELIPSRHKALDSIPSIKEKGEREGGERGKDGGGRGEGEERKEEGGGKEEGGRQGRFGLLY